MRDFAAAERTYQRAVADRPGYWATHAWLGSYFRRQARHEEAAAEYERMVSLVPDSARLYAILGVPRMYIGRYDDAIKAFQKSVAIEPTPEAYVNWGQTLYRMRRFDEAAAMLERAREVGVSGYLVLGDLARARYWAGRRDEAARLYQK